MEGEKKNGWMDGRMMCCFRVIGNDSRKLQFSRMGIRENLTAMACTTLSLFNAVTKSVIRNFLL